jgi:hypothetical protein
MISLRNTHVQRYTGLAAAILCFGSVALCVRGCPPTAEQEAAARAEAQQKWLSLVERGIAFEDADNAAILQRCFKIGEPAADFEQLLATGEKREYTVQAYRIVKYDWTFKVKKPPAVDSTEYYLTVTVKSEPPAIAALDGNYSVD